MALLAASDPDLLVADEPRYTLTQTAAETIVRIKAVDQQVQSSDLVTALSAVADLDGKAVAGKLPEGDFHLSKKRTRLSLFLVEKALGGRAELVIEKNSSGEAVALIIAIDREQLEADHHRATQQARNWLGAIGTVSDHSIEELSWGLRPRPTQHEARPSARRADPRAAGEPRFAGGAAARIDSRRSRLCDICLSQ